MVLRSGFSRKLSKYQQRREEMALVQLKNCILNSPYSTVFTGSRYITTSACAFGIKSRWVAPVRRQFYWRQKKMEKQGKLPVIKRSNFLEWNYDAEIYALNQRLGENIDDVLLRESLTDSSYIFQEEKSRKALGLDEISSAMKSNKSLASTGEAVVNDYCSKYLRAALPLLPEDGVSALVEYLVSEDVMSQLGSAIGLKDLILCQEHPPSPSTFAMSFKAVIGALNASNGLARANKFVLDFVLTHLVGRDINDIWKIENPKDLLEDIMVRSGRGEVEPRLLFESGQNTIQAVYQVGVYSQKTFLGAGYGESVDIAVEQASLDALRRLFHIKEDRSPLPFRADAELLELKSISNLSIKEWSVEKAQNLISV